MRPRLTQRALFRLGFPLCGWLSLALFVFAVSGLPIPIPFAKDLSRAFPCMYSKCGCRNADQCWRSCCCHTAAFRLAWAKAHHVTPPSSLLAAAHAEVATTTKPGNCCQISAASSKQKPCRADAPGGAAPACPSEPAADGGLSLSAALRCHGVGEVVAGVQICLPPLRLKWQPTLHPLAAAGLPLPAIHSPADLPAIRPPRARNC